MLHFLRTPLLTAAFALSVAPILAETPPAPPATTLLAVTPVNQLLGNARALILFAPAGDKHQLTDQVATLDRHSMELAQYDTVLVPVADFNEQLPAVPSSEYILAGDVTQQAVERARFNIPAAGFTVVLLNKDGLEERRWSGPVTMSQLRAEMLVPASSGKR